MADYVLTCCSTVDLTKEHMDAIGVPYANFHYEIDGEQFDDDLFQTMSLYALALFFPDLKEDAREALYLELDRQAYENLYTGIYHDEIIPHILYYQGDIGVFPFFALGEYERFTFLPVPQEKLDGLAAQGTRLVDLDQWSP